MNTANLKWAAEHIAVLADDILDALGEYEATKGSRHLARALRLAERVRIVAAEFPALGGVVRPS